MRIATEYKHIEVDEKGRPFIKGTGYKVIVLLRDHTAWSWDAPEIECQHPGLTLGQAYEMLAYYYDNKAEVDAVMAEQDRMVETFRASHTPSPVIERLRRIKRKLAEAAEAGASVELDRK